MKLYYEDNLLLEDTKLNLLIAEVINSDYKNLLQYAPELHEQLGLLLSLSTNLALQCDLPEQAKQDFKTLHSNAQMIWEKARKL